MAFNSNMKLKRFSLQAAAVLTTLTLFGGAQTVFATSDASNTEATTVSNASTPDVTDYASLMATTTKIEEQKAITAIYQETFAVAVPMLKEELDKAKENLEAVFADTSASEISKLEARLQYNSALGKYEGSIEGQDTYKSVEATISQLEKAFTVEYPTFYDDLEANLTKQESLELLRIKRQVIEEIYAQEEEARLFLQSQFEATKKSLNEVSPATHTLEELFDLFKESGKMFSKTLLPKLDYDFTDIDEIIKRLEEEVKAEEETNATDTTETNTAVNNTSSNNASTPSNTTNTSESTPLLSAETVKRVMADTAKEPITPVLVLDLPLTEMLGRAATTKTTEELTELVKAYWISASLPVSSETLAKTYEQTQAAFKQYSDAKTVPTNETEKLAADLIEQIEYGYLVGLGQLHGNYPYLTQLTLSEANQTISRFSPQTLDTIPVDKQIALLTQISQVLEGLANKPARSNPNLARGLEQLEQALANPTVAEKELLSTGQVYGGSQVWFNPVYTYNTAAFQQALAALRPKDTVVIQTPPSDKVPQSTSASQPSTPILPKKEGGSSNDVARDESKKTQLPTATSSSTTKSTPSSVQALPKTGEASTAILSALGVMSLVTSSGVLATRKRQD